MTEELHELLKDSYSCYTFYHDWVKIHCVKETDRRLKVLDKIEEYNEGIIEYYYNLDEMIE